MGKFKKFWKKDDNVKVGGQSKPKRRFWVYEPVSICYKTGCLVVSFLMAMTILTTSGIALAEAEQGFDIEKWTGLAVTGVVLGVVQILSSVPYGLLWKHQHEKSTYYFWAILHILLAILSIIHFFLAFYMVPGHSDELRKAFWSQFKLKIEKEWATMEAMMVAIDFTGLNTFFNLFMVFYPKVSKVWNRDGRDEVSIVLS